MRAPCFNNSPKVIVSARELYGAISRKCAPATAAESLEAMPSERLVKAITRDSNCSINSIKECRRSQVAIRDTGTYRRSRPGGHSRRRAYDLSGAFLAHSDYNGLAAMLRRSSETKVEREDFLLD